MQRRYSPTPRRARLRRVGSQVLHGPSTWPGGWIIAALTLAAGGSLWRSMDHAGSPARAAAVTFFVGVAGGGAWQWLNRRDLVDRFVTVAWIGVVWMVLALLPFAKTSVDGAVAATGFGLIAGNVLLEWWLRLPSQGDRCDRPDSTTPAATSSLPAPAGGIQSTSPRQAPVSAPRDSM